MWAGLLSRPRADDFLGLVHTKRSFYCSPWQLWHLSYSIDQAEWPHCTVAGCLVDIVPRASGEKWDISAHSKGLDCSKGKGIVSSWPVCFARKAYLRARPEPTPNPLVAFACALGHVLRTSSRDPLLRRFVVEVSRHCLFSSAISPPLLTCTLAWFH